MNILTQFLKTIGGKPTSKQSEWLLPCWMCDRDLLYFNLDKKIGFCVKCWQVRTLRDIALKLAGIPMSKVNEFLDEQQVEEARGIGLRNYITEGLFSGSTRHSDREVKPVEWPEGYRALAAGSSSVVGGKARDYLAKRRFDLSLLEEMGFGYCATGKYGGRVIVPTFERGELVYWQARDFTGHVDPKQKVLNPGLREVATHGKTDVLFNHDLASMSDVVVVTESWGSSLAVGRSAVAINGQHVSDTQFAKIVAMPLATVLILFDPGAEAYAFQAAEKLAPYKTTLIAFLFKGDANEVSSEELKRSIRNAMPYAPSEQLRFRIDPQAWIKNKTKRNS